MQLSRQFIRQLIVQTLCTVTGEEMQDILAMDEVEVDTRDWEQIISRLEAFLDVSTGLLSSGQRVVRIDALAQDLFQRVHGAGGDATD
ncbi:hypothetical protein H5407_07955 [Mitsuaria sp. WAJ17]|uniref:DUF6137 domain-containing protein n=1 Tax=unclassified Roseateles TaxID=2626991 RepID=UPI0015FFE609|nr:DUF6137 domain-containing protein [Mitsuaria sp. WAJ17]MBB2485164.1 hypothetical protein [Mitsuaria sp. WAJ17]